MCDFVTTIRSGLRYNIHGVPVLSHLDIEECAEQVLAEVDPERLRSPGPTDVMGILDYLRRCHGIQAAAPDLGALDGGSLLGQTVFAENRIHVDRAIFNGFPGYRFTVAHEIGHWLLHGARTMSLEDKARAETQAHRFAAALTLPREPFQLEVSATLSAFGVDSRVVSLTSDDASLRQFWDLNLRVAAQFDASKRSVRVRLDSLGLLAADPRAYERVFGHPPRS